MEVAHVVQNGRSQTVEPSYLQIERDMSHVMWAVVQQHAPDLYLFSLR